MSRFYSYINSAKEILSQYKGDIPFAAFIKKYFSLQKKYGSTDRKQISHLCYCYFRLGKLSKNKSIEERIVTGLFLCNTLPDKILEHINPELNKAVTLPLNEKFLLTDIADEWNAIFSFNHTLSESIDEKEFVLSHLQQPNVYLRVRPGKEVVVKDKFDKSGLSFTAISNDCLSLAGFTSIDKVVDLNKEAVVQDLNSQRVGELLALAKNTPGGIQKVWDCCAASGGKSILAMDILGNIQLTVSDVRESILINLKKRFKDAGIHRYKSFVADLAGNINSIKKPNSKFDLVIADVPCSGSGTWGRSPEQLVFFNGHRVDEYAQLQKRIVSNITDSIVQGGYLLYITCSVFRKENEEVVEHILLTSTLKLVKQEVYKGYDRKADTLFAALFCLQE